MTTFTVPTRSEVSENNQQIFDNLEKGLGFVPNLYATLAYSDTALGDFLSLQNRKTSLKAKEKEVVNLVVSQVNGCEYCLAAHTAIGKMNGFSDDQIIEIREGYVTFDNRVSALTNFVESVVINRGKPSLDKIEALYAEGFTKENIVDILVLIGDKTVMNFLHGVTQIPVDFPAAPVLEAVAQ